MVWPGASATELGEMVNGLFELEQPDPKVTMKIATKKITELYLIWIIGRHPR
jgi:hypothetical protein